MTTDEFGRLLSRFEDASVALHAEGTASAQERWEAAGGAVRADRNHLCNALAAAKARANEAARLSAAARDEVADRDKVIAGLRERVEIVEESRQELAVWAVRLATRHHAGYREHGDMDPFEAIEEALALIPDLQGHAKSAELTRTRAQDALESAQSAMHGLVTAGVRNGEVHRRAALRLLEAVGFDADESRDIVHRAEDDS